jgi:hypothetical protein
MQPGDIYKCKTDLRAVACFGTRTYLNANQAFPTGQIWQLQAPTENKVIMLIEKINYEKTQRPRNNPTSAHYTPDITVRVPHFNDTEIWKTLIEEEVYFLWFSVVDLPHLIKLI